jgi:hypothetical protein
MSDKKDKDVVKAFQKLLRCGKDYTTEYMYEEVGTKFYLTLGSTGQIVRRHYQSIITDEMKSFVSSMNGTKHKETVKLFIEKFGFCKRESILLIRYTKRSK